jgi:hypothetical protein
LWSQELASDLKAEVRELLAAKGIIKFVIKPVKRKYAFEVPDVPHCEQWVLKVRYDASLPTLDMGLTGIHPLHYKRYMLCMLRGCRAWKCVCHRMTYLAFSTGQRPEYAYSSAAHTQKKLWHGPWPNMVTFYTQGVDFALLNVGIRPWDLTFLLSHEHNLMDERQIT